MPVSVSGEFRSHPKRFKRGDVTNFFSNLAGDDSPSGDPSGLPWTMARFDDCQNLHTADLAQQPDLARVVRRRVAVLHRQRDAGHGGLVADGRAHRLVVPRRAGADGGVPADVPALAAGRRAGRHHRPAAPDHGGAGAQAGTAALLTVLLLAGLAGPATLLFFTFVAGCCTALLSPAWNSTVADTRAARGDAAGDHRDGDRLQRRARARARRWPAWCLRYVGSGWVFGIAVVSALVMLQAIRRWPPRRTRRRALPAERLWGGTLSGAALCAPLRTDPGAAGAHVAYSAAGSALWALLPVIGQRQLGLGAAGFGLLMGCLGTGAVAPGSSSAGCARGSGWSGWSRVGCVVFAAVMLVAALSRWRAAGLRRAGGRRRGAGWR